MFIIITSIISLILKIFESNSILIQLNTIFRLIKILRIIRIIKLINVEKYPI